MRSLIVLLIAFLLASCVRNKQGFGDQSTVQTENNSALQSGAKVFEVKEVIQTSNYSYLNVKDNLGEKWVAVSRQEIKPGEVFYYDNALQMNNFNSKELNRTFDVIYFVSTISKTPLGSDDIGGMPPHSGKMNAEKSGSITIQKSADEITISQLFSNKAGYAGKEVEIRGVVVKVNEGIMDRNWIHIQDGTSSAEGFDLTITSQDVVSVNDEVTFKGVIAVDKDFGAGYIYDVILENAVLVKKDSAGKTM